MMRRPNSQAEFQLGVLFLVHGSLEKRPANHASGSALCICAALPQSGTRGLPDRDVQHVPPKQGARGRVGTGTGRVRRLLLLRGREACTIAASPRLSRHACTTTLGRAPPLGRS